MGITGLLAALHGIRRALFEPDVLNPFEDISIELPHKAGRRFEVWLKHNAPTHMVIGLAIEEGEHFRSVMLEGVNIKWPMTR